MSQTDEPARDQLDEGAPAPDGVGTDRDGLLDGSPVGRRTLMKGVGASAAGAVALGSDRGMVDESEAVAGTIVIGGAIVAGAALGYLAGEVADHYLGPEPGELTGTEETADLHAELRTRIAETQAANDTVLTQIENRLQDSRNVAWAKAKTAAVKALNNGKTATEAETDAHAAIAAYYTTVQKNVLNRFSEVANSWVNIIDLHESDSNLNAMRFYAEDSTGTYTFDVAGTTVGDHTVTLADGTQYTYNRVSLGSRSWQYDGLSTNSEIYYEVKSSGSYGWDRAPNLRIQIDPVDTGSIQETELRQRWNTLWTDINSQVSQMESNASTYVTDLYSNYSAGDIDPANFLDPTTLAGELSTDYESTGYHAYAAAEAAVLGIPGDFNHSLSIELMDSGITVQGSLWTDWAPESLGETTTSTTTETNTTSTSTTTETTTSSSSGFATGTTYDPANTGKDVYISFEYTGPEFIDGADVFTKGSDGSFTQDGNVTNQSDLDALETEYVQVYFGSLTEPFTITSATNVETGESVSEVTLESKNKQTAEVSLTEEQMQLLTELRTQLRENEKSGGGGGGVNLDQFDLFGIPGEGVLLGAAALITYLGGRD